MNSEVEAKKYDQFDLDKNNNLNNKISKKRPEINRSISLTSSYEKRNLITNTLPPSKSLDNQLTTGKKPIAFHFKNLKKFKSKLPHLQAVQPTSATSLSSANQPPKLASTKASSFDTTILLQSRSSVPLNGQLHSSPIKLTTPNLHSLRPRSVSDCSNCVLSSQVHLAHRAQHEFIQVIKRDREFISSLRKSDKRSLFGQGKVSDKEKEEDKENRDGKQSEQPEERTESKKDQTVGQTIADQKTTKQTGQSKPIDQSRQTDKSNQFDSTMNRSQSRQDSISEATKDKCLTKRTAKLNIGDVVRRFREKHRQQFPDRPPINLIKATAICIDDYAFAWCPPGLNGEQASCAIARFSIYFLRNSKSISIKGLQTLWKFHNYGRVCS